MASKRMFSLTVIDTDAFLEMPLSTQALYFHLNMRADDDGFVGSPKIICRTVGASEDDLKLLIAKRFILLFEDGVIVIKHWRLHNTLSYSRYKETNYIENKALLKLKSNNAYTFDENGAEIDDSRLIASAKRQSVSPKTNNRRTIDEHKTNTDKNSIDKNSIDKINNNILSEESDDNTNDTSKLIDSFSVNAVFELYDKICISFPKCVSKSDRRKKMIKKRLEKFTIKDFEKVFESAEASDFLSGRDGKWTNCGIDWLLNETNMVKVLEGNYNRNKPKEKQNSKFNNFEHREYDYTEIEKRLLGNTGGTS